MDEGSQLRQWKPTGTYFLEYSSRPSINRLTSNNHPPLTEIFKIIAYPEKSPPPTTVRNPL